ncbi:MAG: SGNH hydrolase domain-containing protein [Gammaproteobacteria bacterium]
MLLLVLASVFLGSVSYYIYYNNGFVNRLEIFSKISKAAGEWDYPGRLESSNFNGIPYYFQRSSLPGTTIYVGDSNVEQYYPRIEQLIKSSPGATNSAIFKTGGGCLPVPGQSYGALHSHCASLMPEVYALVKGKPEIDRIVIGAQWNGYLSLGFGLASTVSEGDAAYQAILSGLSKFIREMVADGKKVYLITNIPTGKKLDPKYMARRDISAFPDVFKMRDGGVSKSNLESKYGGIRKDLIRVGNESGAVVIDPVDYLCVTHCESLDAQGNPMYKDSSHLRPMFVRDKVFFLDDTVLK